MVDRRSPKSTAARIETVVQPDGKIELSIPQLTPGQHVTVVVKATETGEANVQAPQKRHVAGILAEVRGYLRFQTAEEIDAYIREERDSWER